MTPAEASAYRAGRIANATGDARTTNPYYQNTPQWRAWNDGWDSMRPSLLNRLATWVVNCVARREY